MRILRQSSEAEMIYEYLRAEYTSERFSGEIKAAMGELSLTEGLILEGDINNAAENAMRKRLLGRYRGYGEDREMFERFPHVSEWSLCSFGGEDMDNIRYIDYSYWNELSSHTGSPIKAAENIRGGLTVFGVSSEGFIRAAEYIRGGGEFPAMFFLTADNSSFVIVEGHQRMTGYALASEYFSDVRAIVGVCAENELKNWM